MVLADVERHIKDVISVTFYVRIGVILLKMAKYMGVSDRCLPCEAATLPGEFRRAAHRDRRGQEI